MRYILFLFIIVLFGCNSEQHFLKQAAKHPEWLKTTDSITTHIDTTRKYKDTTIKIAGSQTIDTASLSVSPLGTTGYIIPIKVTPIRKVTHNKGSTNSLTVLSNGKIIDTCKCDSVIKVIKQLTETIQKITSEKKTIVIPPVIKKLNIFQKIWGHYVNFCVVSISIIILLIIIYILGRSLKFLPKIPGLPF